MGKLEKSARGRECQVRIPGVCNYDPATVVLCHLHNGGMGRKCDSLFAFFGCSDCHDVCDGRRKTSIKPDYIKEWTHEAVFRTQKIWLDEGLIKID